MAPIAIVFGLLLTALGPILFFLSATHSPTAFIPSGFGIVLIICGVLARNDKLRMHVMHLAALLGLIGFAMPTFMATRSLLNGNAFETVRHGGQFAMAGLCLLFVILCVKSFIDVRIARKKAAETQATKEPIK